MSETPPPIDAARLIAALRERDQATIAQAYRQVFDGPVGRLVLADALREVGVGRVRPRNMGGEERAFQDGAAAAVLLMAERAGFDAASVVLAQFTGQMEGPDHDRSSQPRRTVVPGEDGF